MGEEWFTMATSVKGKTRKKSMARRVVSSFRLAFL